MTQSSLKTKLTRYVACATLAMLTSTLVALSACSSTGLSAREARSELVYVGNQEREIHALRFDPATGRVEMIGKVADGTRSTWVAAHPELPVLYAVDDDNTKEGSVTAYAVNRDTGALSKINQVGTKGSGTTNLYIDIPSMTLLAANYGGGSVSSMVIDHDGSLGALISNVKESGSGPTKRQASAHAHSAAVDPSGRYVLVPDLGADRVFIYGFDRSTHRLSEDGAVHSRSFIAPAGSGPRHIAFGANGQFVYLITELSAEVMVFRWNADRGKLDLVQSVPLSSEGFNGGKSGAEIAVSADGRFVYAENRGEDALSVYRINPASGELGLVQRVASGGQKPWGFAIDPSGKWMLVANQRNGQVNVFRIDTVNGTLSDTGEMVSMTSPVSVAFVE